MVRRRQPSVLVYLSRVTASGFEDDPSVLLSASSTAPAAWQRKCWVSVGTLTLLRVGDIWRDQRPYLAPDYQVETFDLDVGDDTSDLVKAGLSRDGGFLLPLEHHPWHLNNTHAYCLAVALPDGREVVVPCMELVRFYFGSSSSLLTRLFTPPLSRDSLLTKSVFGASRKHLHLTLAEGVSAASAVDIGRMATSEVAWRAALQVGTSCLLASTTGAPHGVHPKTSFPFQGRTVLTAAGKWLPRGDRAEATFVVFSLRQCEWPFKFRSLEYRLSGPGKPRRQVGAAEPTQPAVRSQRQAEDAKHLPLVERDAGHRLAARHRSLPGGHRFPDLADKHIWGSRKIQATGTAAIASRSAAGPIPAGALGEPGSSQRIRPLEVAQALKADGRPAMPAFLKDVVEALTAVPGLEANLLTAAEDDGWTIPVNLLADEDGVIDQYLFVAAPDGTGRPRRVAVFDLQGAQRCDALAVIESEPFVAVHYDDWTSTVQGAFPGLLELVSKDFVAAVEARRAGHAPTTLSAMHELLNSEREGLQAWLMETLMGL